MNIDNLLYKLGQTYVTLTKDKSRRLERYSLGQREHKNRKDRANQTKELYYRWTHFFVIQKFLVLYSFGRLDLGMS